MSQEWLSFRDDSVSGAIKSWWEDLQDNKGGCAELRRCARLEDVFACRPFYDLRSRLSSHANINNDRLAATVLCLSRVKQNCSESFAERMGTLRNGTPLVSEARFRELIRSRDKASLTKSISSILSVLRFEANVVDLAENVYWWGPKAVRATSIKYYESVLEIENKRS